MKITNKHNLPATVVNMVSRRTKYERPANRLAVTTLLSAPKPDLLKHLHWDELQKDASDEVWSLLGEGIHKALERGSDGMVTIPEEKLVVTMDGVQISGKIDLQTISADGFSIKLTDYKVTTAWSAMQEKPEWETQLNVYAWMVTNGHRGLPVDELEVMVVVRDWSRYEASKDPQYPPSPIFIYPVKLWPMDKTEDYIRGRIAVHQEALFAHKIGDPLPDCTPEERWAKPDTYVVRTEEATKAKRVVDTLKEAKEIVAKGGSGLRIYRRHGKSGRCVGFCQAAPWCEQWAAIQKAPEEEVAALPFAAESQLHPLKKEIIECPSSAQSTPNMRSSSPS